MEQVLAEAERIGWQKALKNNLKDPLLIQHIAGEQRTAWKYFFPLPPKKSVFVDVGSGWGTLSFSLAKEGFSVVSLDYVAQRVKFCYLRKKQDGFNNVFPLCGSGLNLPLKDSCAYGIILNAVLEWAGYFRKDFSPHVLQKKMLSECWRVLKEGGRVYIAIENRTSLIYFLGAKDPHSGLRFTVVLPRFLANIYSKLKKGVPYRAYIYSMVGYRNLLRSAGFKSIKFYASFPSFRNFEYILPLKNKAVIKFFLRNTHKTKYFFLLKVISRLAGFLPLEYIFPCLVPDYYIVAQK